MSVVPAGTLNHPDRPITCQEALSEDICAIANEAAMKGWSVDEITVAIMETTNAWYFDRAADEKTHELIGQ